MHLNPDVIEHILAGTVTLDDVALIMQADLPLLTDAQLACLLGEIHMAEASPVARVLEPLARDELTRRRSRQAMPTAAGLAEGKRSVEISGVEEGI